jgi:polysaccharide biosynthesis/export protein
MNTRPVHSLLAVALFSTGLPLIAATASDRPVRQDISRPAVRPEASRSSSSPRSELKSVSIGDSTPSSDYVLQPQDVLRVFVFQHDDLNKQTEAVSISKEYTISLPLIRTVNLKGKSVRQAEEMIRAAYDKDYLVNPQVSVMVVKYGERSVNVAGAVNTAGRVIFPKESGLTILDAISLAGGFSRLADLKHVKLTRRNDNGETVAEEVNVDQMIKGGRETIELQKDDNIFVPERIL